MTPKRSPLSHLALATAAAGAGCLLADDGPAPANSTAAPFAAWTTAHMLPGVGPEVDSDGDGIPNGIEFVIGGDPSGPDSDSTHLLPTAAIDATYLYFTYRRSDDSQGMPEAQQPFVQFGSDLAGWSEFEPGEPLANPVVVAETGGTPDLVTVKIPRALASGTALYVRLRVDIE